MNTNTTNISYLKNKYDNYGITSGNMNDIGSGIIWVNGYGSIANNPFTNIHSMGISQGNGSKTYNQLLISTNGEMLFRHSDDGISFDNWVHCSSPTVVSSIDYMTVSKSGKMVTLTCPSSVIYLNPNGLITNLSSVYAPSHDIKTFATLYSDGTNCGTTHIEIHTNGNIYQKGTATGSYEVCFTVSFLTK